MFEINSIKNIKLFLQIINEKAKFKSGPVNFAARKAQLMKERDQAAQAYVVTT